MALRAETEALRRSDALKTTLLRAMSHDLRSPLTAIMTSASALAEAELLLDDADRRELSEMILEEAMRLDRLVSNLLDLSRLDAGAISTQLDVCPIDVLLAKATDAVEAGRRIDLSLPEEPVLVHADPHQIERALVNLIENALHHSPATEPVYVRVRWTRSEAFVRHRPRARASPRTSWSRSSSRSGAAREPSGCVAQGSALQSHAALPTRTAAGCGQSRSRVKVPPLWLHYRWPNAACHSGNSRVHSSRAGATGPRELLRRDSR
jgi:His Kinase A (phospho-acceptor) domain